MEKEIKKIQLKSKNEKQLIAPTELLLPLNAFVNLTNLLEFSKELFNEFNERRLARGEEVDFARFFEISLLNSRTIKSADAHNAVQLDQMGKKSPYWLDLIITVSPLVPSVLKLLLEQNQDIIMPRLIELLNKIPSFRDINDDDKKMQLAMKVIRSMNRILDLVNIIIDNDYDNN
jgi:hypothetical protein